MMVSRLHFRLGARLGSSTSFRLWIQKLRPQRDSNPQSSASKSDALSVRLCGLLRFPISVFFCNETLRVMSKMAHSACYRLSVSIFFFAQNWYLLSSSVVCLVESGQTDVAGSFSFMNHDRVLRPRNWNLRPQRDFNLRSSDLGIDTLPVGLWGLFQYCFATVIELTEVWSGPRCALSSHSTIFRPFEWWWFPDFISSV